MYYLFQHIRKFKIYIYIYTRSELSYSDRKFLFPTIRTYLRHDENSSPRPFAPVSSRFDPIPVMRLHVRICVTLNLLLRFIPPVRTSEHGYFQLFSNRRVPPFSSISQICFVTGPS